MNRLANAGCWRRSMGVLLRLGIIAAIACGATYGWMRLAANPEGYGDAVLDAREPTGRV